MLSFPSLLPSVRVANASTEHGFNTRASDLYSEVFVSNLGRDTRYPDSASFHDFPRSLLANAWIFHFNILSNSLFVNRLTIRRYSDSVVKQKKNT
jgi:hypothetical protein